MAYIAELYSHVHKPTWASGTYQPTVMQSRAYDYEIMNTRSNVALMRFPQGANW